MKSNQMLVNMRTLVLILLVFSTFSVVAQPWLESIANIYKWRNIGPANQGGRIVDIEALESDFTKVYMATGSGGVWYSDNAGTTWTPIFDDYSTASIGDIAVYQQDPSIVWVGTGEANNRNSVSWGDGVFKSTDGGKTFQNMGLNSTHQIARVITFPGKPDEACVCAIGHLWGYSGERGLFKTTDGGESWTKITDGLPDDGKTGCNDLVIDPSNPQVLYASFYHRLRQPWHFHSGGENGGIFKSTDGGNSWTKLSNGLPEGPTGRIGLAIYRTNPDIVMAIVEAEKTDDLSKPGSGIYRTEDGGQSWKYINTYNNRPFYYSQIRINPLDDQRVYIMSTRFMVSEDGGVTLENGSKDEEVHGDFHALWHDPTYKDRYYLGADKGLSLTHDHGKSFTLFDNLPIGQFYRINYDYQDPYYVMGGLQDNGFYATASFSRDIRGILNDSNWKVHWGDGQYTESDPDNVRNLITSAENAAVYRYDILTHDIEVISPRKRNITNLSDYYTPEQIKADTMLRFNWESPMHMAQESKNLYVAGNHVMKSTNNGDSWQIISPDLSTNAPEKTLYRASGGITPDNSGAETHCAVTTLALSNLDENIMWIGTDDGLVHLTRNGGKSWKSLRKKLSDVPDGIWVSRMEASAHDDKRAYIAFDGHRSDHNKPYLFVTDDWGKNWNSITSGLPEDLVIRVVKEDPFNEDLLFIGTETGIWASVNRGGSWFKFMPGLPTVSVYDLAIHPRDRDLIAGTHGRSIWVMDQLHILEQMTSEIASKDFHLFEPQVATIWENTSRGGQRGHFWFGGENPEEVRPVSSIPRGNYDVDVVLHYYLGNIDEGSQAEFKITDPESGKVYTKEIEINSGLNKLVWNREFDPQPYTEEETSSITAKLDELVAKDPRQRSQDVRDKFLSAEGPQAQREVTKELINRFNFDLDEELALPKAGPGSYEISLSVNGATHEQTLTIRTDPLNKK